MKRGKETYILGRGKLILPNGQELEVSEMSLEFSDAPIVRDRAGMPTRIARSTEVTVTFKEPEDGDKD